MIRKVSVNFPELGVNVSHEFGPGVNLVEEKNGYGKTTLLNALLSTRTGKFGTKPIPTGTATVVTDAGEFILNKGLWVGLSEQQDPIAKFVMPGAFFSLGSTTDQRAAIVSLLKLDKSAFMQEKVKDWTEKTKSELNSKIKFNEGKADEILEDITRLKAAVLEYEKSPVVERDNSKEIETAYANSVSDYETKRNAAISGNASAVSAENEKARKVAELERKAEELRKKYESVQMNPTCPSCGQNLSSIDETLEAIAFEGSLIVKELEKAKAIVTPMRFEVPEQLPYLSISEKAEKVGMVLDVTTESEMQRKRDYGTAKRDLEDKSRRLKELGELKDKEILKDIEEREREFTEFLQAQTSSLGLEIELFKTQKNGEAVESFVIYENGVPYSELSNGRKLVIQFKLAAAFADRLGIDFLLLDEAGTLSSDSLAEIVKVSGGKQIIMARAKPFTKKEVSAQ